MATESMLSELSQRRRWVEDVNAVIREISSDPHHVAVWPDLRPWYGRAPYQAAVQYLSRAHLYP